MHPLEVYDSKVERAALLVDEWVDPMAKILLDIRRAMFDDNREEDVIVVIHCEVKKEAVSRARDGKESNILPLTREELIEPDSLAVHTKLHL